VAVWRRSGVWCVVCGRCVAQVRCVAPDYLLLQIHNMPFTLHRHSMAVGCIAHVHRAATYLHRTMGAPAVGRAAPTGP
jgi:hypothetical protein